MIRRILFISCLCFLYVTSLTPAFATDLPRLIIVGNDASPNTLPRNSRPFKEVLNNISGSLLNEGFDVKDEIALSLGSKNKIKDPRNEAEILQKAKDLGIDIAIIFSIYPNKKTTKNSVRIRPRVEGRLVSVYDGSRLGNFDIKSQTSKPVQKPYSINDEQEALADIAAVLGKEVGAVLTDRIAQYVDAEGGRLQEWELVIDGYNNYEVMDMEDIFRTFEGYDSHRIKANAQNYSSHSEFFYKSSADSAKLKRDFVRMLKKLNLKGSISISGLKVSISKNRGLKHRMIQQNSW